MTVLSFRLLAAAFTEAVRDSLARRRRSTAPAHWRICRVRGSPPWPLRSKARTVEVCRRFGFSGNQVMSTWKGSRLIRSMSTRSSAHVAATSRYLQALGAGRLLPEARAVRGTLMADALLPPGARFEFLKNTFTTTTTARAARSTPKEMTFAGCARYIASNLSPASDGLGCVLAFRNSVTTRPRGISACPG